MMIVVAIVAVLIWGEKMRQLRVNYLTRAERYADERKYWLREIGQMEINIANWKELKGIEGRLQSIGPMNPQDRIKLDREIQLWIDDGSKDAKLRREWYNAAVRLELIYRHAASYPWRTIKLAALPFK